tara:strand:+ start:19 stop:384 length:366 start_codon:yes stop_codon:yes gene_type:complete
MNLHPSDLLSFESYLGSMEEFVENHDDITLLSDLEEFEKNLEGSYQTLEKELNGVLLEKAETSYGFLFMAYDDFKSVANVEDPFQTQEFERLREQLSNYTTYTEKLREEAVVMGEYSTEID